MNACRTKSEPSTDAGRIRASAKPVRPPESSPAEAGDEIALRDGALWSLDRSVGAVQVRCISGNVWLTQAGRAEDIVIGPGGTCVLPGTGKIVVQALEDAIVRIEQD
ncbi:MAG: DUF2917 domain-containing protein [Tepidisphaeraceae bacterium]